MLARGRRVPVRRARRRAGALRGGGPRALLPRARSRGRSRSGCSSAAGPSASTTWPPIEPIAREPVRAGFRGRDVLTNPPPSSGGILIAFALDLLDRLGDAGRRAASWRRWRRRRPPGPRSSHAGLPRTVRRAVPGPGARSTRPPSGSGLAFARPAGGVAGPGDRLGSTTHITAVDGDGRCASVTCSNGTGSGLIVPGTGVHVNNMLGEEDLNPLGFHAIPPGGACRR